MKGAQQFILVCIILYYKNNLMRRRRLQVPNEIEPEAGLLAAPEIVYEVKLNFLSWMDEIGKLSQDVEETFEPFTQHTPVKSVVSPVAASYNR